MSDRELLEAAAKAAGYKVTWVTQYDCGLTDAHMMDLPEDAQYFCQTDYPHARWNPLADDGDALRLAVGLGLSIEMHTDQTQPLPWLRVVDREGNWTHAGPGGAYSADPMRHTRRTIVIAAAKCS